MSEPQLKSTVLAVMTLLLLVLPEWSRADGINGYAEYGYSLLKTNSTSSTISTETKGESFSQRYNLTLLRSLSPTLRLTAGGNVLLDKSESDTSGLTSTSSSSRINPSVDLTYQGSNISGGIGFNRRMDSSTSNGVSPPTLFFDTYNARLSWLPEDLPTLNLIFSTADNFDENHTSRDSTSTSTSFSSRYNPIKSLDLNYQGNYATLKERINGIDSQTFTQSLRTAYSDTFLKNRLGVSSSYIISMQESEFQSRSGRNDRLLSKLSDYYARTNDNIFPVTSPHFIDNTTPTLIPGTGFATVIPSAPPPPLTFNSVATAPPTFSDHLGMQFFDILPLVDKVRVVVRPTYRPGTTSLPDALISLFSETGNGWKVFTSRDGRTWNQIAGLTFARDTTFNSLDGSEAVTVGFNATQAQYIKVVTKPVGLSTVLSNQVTSVEFTRLEAFITESISSGGKKSTQVSGIYDLNLKASLWDLPLVMLDSGINLSHNKSNTTDLTYAYTLTNGLSVYHNFNPKLSGSARLSREDAVNLESSRSSNAASVSLSATPLSTLFYSLNYSARQEQDSGKSRTSHAVNLTNSAELYRGISAALTLGGGIGKDNTGLEQRNVLTALGINMTPHRTLAINLSGSDSRSWVSGGGQPSNSNYTRAMDASINYAPFQGLYLFSSLTISSQSRQSTQTAQSFGGAWSPFRDGALLLNLSYRESIQNDGTKDRSLSSSLRWTIRHGTFLDLGYLILTGSAPEQKSETQSFSALLRITI